MHFYIQISSNTNTWDRIPSLWLQKGHDENAIPLDFRTEIGTNGNYAITSSETIQKDSWTTVTLKQTRSGSRYFFTATVNGVEVGDIENTNPVRIDIFFNYFYYPYTLID